MSESTFPNPAATGAIIPPDGYNGEYGSAAVVTSGDGNTVAFGTPQQSNSGDNAGLVQVFTRSGNSFSQKGGNIIGTAGQSYGTSLALNQDGTILFVGADASIGLIIYEYDSNNNEWNVLQNTLDASRSNGSAVVITADAEFLATSTNASLVLYQRVNGSNLYNTSAVASVRPTSVQGNYLDIGYDGSNANTIRILVGEPNANSFVGLTELYRYDGTSTLALVQSFSSPGGAFAGWGSGVSMTSDASRFAIGSVNSNVVQVYDDDGSGNNYVQFGSDLTGTASYRFGIRVAMSSNTKNLVIGSQYFDTGSLTTAVGKVHLYEPSGSEYVETGFSLTGTTPSQRLGSSVAVDDDTTIIVSGSSIATDESAATLTQGTSMCLTDSTLLHKMVEI